MMMKNLTVTIVQQNIIWENPQKNRSHLEEFLQSSTPVETDLIVFPEMFTTGFTMNTPENSDSMDGETIHWMHKMARKHNCMISGSAILQEEDRCYNRFILASADRILATYDKKHLFRMSEENLNFTSGKNPTIFTYGQWRIKPIICYDLRFPVWIRNRNDYDVLLVVANWPASRSHIWLTLLQARAIENQTYVIGVNRTGIDGYGIKYDGNSVIINPKGEIISQNKSSEEFHETITLGYDELLDFRAKFPAWMDADNFTLAEG